MTLLDERHVQFTFRGKEFEAFISPAYDYDGDLDFLLQDLVQVIELFGQSEED